MNRRQWVVAAGALSSLAGCASLRTAQCEVATFGAWPTGRPPGTYAFDRLPSQQAQVHDSEQIEALARPALEAAGFKAAAPDSPPDFLVQLAARITRFERNPWDDPLWWRGAYGGWHVRPWGSPYWGLGRRIDSPRYEREVAILVRDRRTGEPLYEARASSDGLTEGASTYIRALFDAALKDFPGVSSTPHTVSVPLITVP